MKFYDEDTVSELVNIAAHTAKIKELHIPHMKIRPQMHILIYGKYGMGKSTLLYELARDYNVPVGTNFTKASLIGSADKNSGDLIPPITWIAKDKPLLIDELNFNTNKDQDVINSFLQVLENPKYTRTMGIKIRDFRKKGLVVKNNTLYVDTRFSFIGTTMMPLTNTRSEMIKAMISRFIVIPFFPSIETLRTHATGSKTYHRIKYIVQDVVKVDLEAYNTILKHLTDLGIEKYPEIYLRTIGDAVRVYAVLKKHDTRLYALLIDLKRSFI